jgi:hypothetical protein
VFEAYPGNTYNSDVAASEVKIRPGTEATMVQMAAGLAAIVGFFMLDGALKLLAVMLAAALIARIARSGTASHGDELVMRGLVRTVRVRRADVERFDVRDRLGKMREVVALTTSGRNHRVPGATRPIEPHALTLSSEANTDEVLARLHLWRAVNTR